MATSKPETPVPGADRVQARLDLIGCPFEAGSRESVLWLQGFLAGAVAGAATALTGVMPGDFPITRQPEGSC